MPNGVLVTAHNSEQNRCNPTSLCGLVENADVFIGCCKINRDLRLICEIQVVLKHPLSGKHNWIYLLMRIFHCFHMLNHLQSNG